MKLKGINITKFRHLQSIDFTFGKVLTVIAGGNGTGKTSLLGMIGHAFKFGTTTLTLFNQRFETRYSEVFRFSDAHDSAGNYKYRLNFPSSFKDSELRITTEKGKVRHRIDVGGRQRGHGKITKPVIFLSLKRLFPLAQENERNIKIGIQSLTPSLIADYQSIYNEIFSSTEIINPVHVKAINKNSFSPTTANFDLHGISAGQDNVGNIILALLSFKNLKNIDQDYDGGLLLIDEIDATLYPAAQKNLLKVLLRMGRELDLQIIFTTHSSDILNFLNSRSGSSFKNDTNFVSLTNALGSVSVKEGFPELEALLADLNHEVVRGIKPKKINFYFEDNEALLFYKGIVGDINIGCNPSYKENSFSCGIYKTLIDNGFEEFFRSVVVLDGDAKNLVMETDENTVCLLPSISRPENVIKDFLDNLPESDIFWNNSHQYTKRVYLNDVQGIKDNRVDMKKWFQSQLEFWGDDGKDLFTRWRALNSVDANAVINRTRSVVKRINENFYALSTYN